MNNLTLNWINAPVTTQSINLDTLKESYLNEMDSTEKTFKTYSKGIKSFTIYLKENNIHEINSVTLVDYKKHLIKYNFKNTTINTYINACKQFFHFLKDKNIITEDIGRNVKPLKTYKDGFLKESIPADKLNEILNTFDTKTEKGLRDLCIIESALCLGLRANEIVNINIGDIKVCSDGYFIRLLRKGETTKCKEIQLPKEVFNLYSKYLQMKPNDLKGLNMPLFTRTSNNGRGKKISTTSLSVMAKEVLKKVGLDLPTLSLHSFRHSFATELRRNNVDIQEVSQAMGHSSVTMTQRYDNHLNTMNNPATRIMASMYCRKVED